MALGVGPTALSTDFAGAFETKSRGRGVGAVALLLILGSILLAAALAPSAALATPTPVAAYSFDEGSGATLHDSAGNHDGTISGATWTSGGKYGSALDFDGRDDLVSVADAADLDFTRTFTLEAWVRPDTITASSPVIAKDENTGAGNSGYLLSARYLGRPSGYVAASGASKGAVGSSLPPTSTWSHLAFTSDGTTLRLYIDGQSVATQSAIAAAATGANLQIGHDSLLGGYFDGLIDEVRLYDQTLSQGEVQGDMDAEVGLAPTPVAAYSFDEGSGATLHDSAGNHDGTISGATWTSGGKYGSALDFDGRDDLVSVADAADLDFTRTFTLEAWVRPDTITASSPVIAKDENTGAGNSGYLLSARYLGRPSGYVAASGASKGAVGSSLPPTSTWSHLAFTSDGTTLRLYIDGQSVATQSAIAAAATGANLQIGHDSLLGGYFDGLIDEVRLYDQTLSQGEVQGDMDAEVGLAPAPYEDPIAAYSFDEGTGTTANDSAGDHDGTVAGAEWVGGGKFGGALYFDGEGAQVVVPDSDGLDFGDAFTLEAWVRADPSEYQATVVTKESTRLFSYGLYAGGAGKGVPEAYVASSDSTYVGVVAEEAIPERDWSHLSFTFDDDTLRLYIDGKLERSTVAFSPQSTDGPLRIGANEVLGEYFEGKIDEVRIYNRALSRAEIEADQTTAIETPPSEQPIAAYSFDEGTGTTVADSADDHDGTINGAAWEISGKYGAALDFDGTDDVVEVADAHDLGLGNAFTLEAWVKPHSTGAWRPVITKETNDSIAYQLYAAGENEEPEGYIAHGASTDSNVTAEDELTEDTWSHLALSYDEKDLRLYLNGELEATEPSASAQDSDGPLQIGGTEVFDQYFDGLIDEMRVYDRALAVEELVDDRDTAVGVEHAGTTHILTPERDLIHNWKSVPSNSGAINLDEAMVPVGAIESTDHIEATGADQVYEASVTDAHLAGAPLGLSFWFYAQTGSGTDLQVDVLWGGRVQATAVVDENSPYAWRNLVVSTPPDNEASNGLSFRFRSLTGRDAKVRAALFKLIAERGGATVTGLNAPNEPLTITPSGNHADDSINVGSCCEQPILIIQRMPTTKLVNRIMVGDFAFSRDCVSPALSLRVDEAKGSGIGDGYPGVVYSERVKLPSGGEPQSLTFNFIPFTLKKGRSYVVRLASSYSSGACVTLIRRTWAHQQGSLEPGPDQCESVLEQSLNFARMWHVAGRNDAVSCAGGIPANFSVNMPTGWLVVWRYHSGVPPTVRTTTTQCLGEPSYGVRSKYWRETYYSESEYVCVWPQFSPLIAVNRYNTDGWYRSPWYGDFNGQTRDIRFSAWLDKPSLVEHYKPYLKFDSEEEWRPLNLEYMVSDPGTYREVPHLYCPRGLTGRCSPLEDLEALSFEDTSEAALDLHGGGDNDVEDYRTPSGSGCTTSAVWDCNSGDRSVLYWHVDDALEDPEGYRFIQYWAFYRFNAYPLGDHEGDWEAVAVAPSQYNQQFGAFDLVSFSQHGSWFSYLRENLECQPQYVTNECGTNENRDSKHPVVYVADGSHANYPDSCQNGLELGIPPSITVCGRNGGALEPGGYPPEADHNGAADWGNNGHNANGLSQMPDAGWPFWEGLWGASGSPESPGQQGLFAQPWDECADDNDGCFDEFAAREWIAELEVEPDSPRLRRCEDWFGGDVAFVACNEGRLARAVEGRQLGKAGDVRAAGRNGVIGTRPGLGQTAESFDAAPGIAQTVGGPLKVGDTIALREGEGERVRVLAHVFYREKIFGISWDGVALGATVRLQVAADEEGIYLKDLIRDKAIEPSGVDTGLNET